MIQEHSLLKGRYRLEQAIGRGGMADVYLAFDEVRQAPVAVKVLREDMAEDPVLVRRFAHEAEALAKLDHPNIVHFYAFEQDGPLAFIVMDYIEGTTLRWRLRDQHSPLPLDEVTRIVRDLRSALHYAHLNGFVHRDLKPGNVMLPRDGKALLTDFGIVHTVETTTLAGPIAGTPAYMSPEQIEEDDVTAKSDIYSLGVLMFEMVTGRLPFTGTEPGLTQTGTTSRRVREAHLRLSPPNPRDLNPALPQAAASVILRALAKRPADRWPDVLTLCRAWESAVSATDATPITSPEIAELIRSETPVKPRRSRGIIIVPAILVPAILVLALVVIGVVIVLATRTGQADEPPPAAAPAAEVLNVQVSPTAPAPTATRKPSGGGGVAVVGVTPSDTPAPVPPTPEPTHAPTTGSAAGEPTIAPTFTPYVPPTLAPSNTPVPIQPTATRPAATRAATRTPAPGGVVLEAPLAHEKVVGTASFQWSDQPGFKLAAGEQYELIIWGVNENPMVNGRSPVGAGAKTAYTVNLTPVEAGLGLTDGVTYLWGVRLFANGAPVRMLSDGRAFVYGRAGGGGQASPGGCVGPACDH